MFRDFDHFAIQGHDYKARRWMQPFGDKVHYFLTARDLIKLLGLRGRKCVIFRYMNSDTKLATDIKYTLLICFICAFRKFYRIQIYWIMHNIDAETVDLYPFLTQIRRRILMWVSKKVFVTDIMFKERFFPRVNKVEAISFGHKRGGKIRTANLEKIARLRREYDLVAVCLSAVGEKYVHYERLRHLADLAEKNGSTIAFILPSHINLKKLNCINIDEPNIDEEAIAPYVDFVYRINDDVSMPYTVYAACGARIPIVTARKYFTHEIIRHYGIGFDEAGFFSATSCDRQRVEDNMERFLERSDWLSLSKRILATTVNDREL